MLKVSGICKSFGGRTVLDAVTFVVNPGEVAGVIGPNGAGKTTLLDIIAGVAGADAGSVDPAAYAGAGLGYLPQGYQRDAAVPVAAVFPRVFSGSSLAARVEHLAAAMERAGRNDMSAIEEEYAHAIESQASLDQGAVDDAWRALGLRTIAPDELLGVLSGGEQTKLGLVELVAARPHALLLDEPTNNLDLPALEWLDGFLDAFRGPVLIVSHDRALLDDHASLMLELDERSGRVEEFAGNYSAYAEEKARREAELWARYRRQQEREAQLQREIRSIGDTARRRERISQNDYYRGRNKKFARRGVMLRRRLEREVASEQHLDKPQGRAYRVKADMSVTARGGDRMIFGERLTIDVDGHHLLREASVEIGWAERVVLTGANGSGKTTLLRALLGSANVHSGRVGRSPSANVGYLPQNEEAPGAVHRTPVDLVRATAALSETEARRFLHRFLFGGDHALTPIDRLSYGERRRLALARLVLSGANILLLDEPTNHLDIPSREAFEQALESYQGAMLAVTHDRFFIDRFAQRVIRIEDQRLIEM